jgi:hypothetical protein
MSRHNYRIREVVQADVESIVELLTRGFPNPRRYWEVAFQRLQKRSVPPFHPRYGYLLEADGRPVGTILLISSLRCYRQRQQIWTNLSSWYVEPEFRSLATLLHKRAVAEQGATYLNVSPAPHTYATLEILGFRRYSEGQVAAFLTLARNRQAKRVRILSVNELGDCGLEEKERQLLEVQASHGCIVFCCVTEDRISPFVFVPRLVRSSIPCAQLAYCRGVNDLVDVAGSVGRHLLNLGRPVVLIDANGPIRGIPGKYFAGAMPKYYKGIDHPVLGDVTETEITVFGF